MNVLSFFNVLTLAIYSYGFDVGVNIPPLAIKQPMYTILSDNNTPFNVSSTTQTKTEIVRPVLTNFKCGIRHGTEYNRIVGGELAQASEFPWQVSVQAYPTSYAKHICGGAILSTNWIITAAHCLLEVSYNNIGIVAGEYNLYKVEGNEQHRRVSKAVTNSFDDDNFARDIALLKLDRHLEFNDWVAPICLPFDEETFTGEGIVAGWGRTTEFGMTPQELNKVSIPLVPIDQCKVYYENLHYEKYFSGCQLCSGAPGGGKDACQGDSGGPMICKDNVEDIYYLCGIVSWGIGCGRPEFPGVYTQVSCYSDWIYSIINNRQSIFGLRGRRRKWFY